MSTQKVFHKIFVLIAVLLSGCASVPITPLPVYANAIGAYAEADNDGGLDITDRKATKTMRVALVPTKNTRETARYMVGKQRECIAYDFPHDAVAFDAERLTQSISQILKNKFKSVVRADSIDSPAAQSADFVILNDIRVSVGGWSGQHTTVTLENFVLDKQRQIIASFSGEGSGVVPYPALSLGIHEAIDRALNRLSAAYDGTVRFGQTDDSTPAPVSPVIVLPAPGMTTQPQAAPQPTPAPGKQRNEAELTRLCLICVQDQQNACAAVLKSSDPSPAMRAQCRRNCANICMR